MKSVGLHFRIHDSLATLAEQAVQSQVPYFQFFLMAYGAREYVHFSQFEVDAFVTRVAQSAHRWFVHGSYFVNLASGQTDRMHKLLRRELAYARTLGATHLVAHSGTHARGKTLVDGIDAMARVINKATKSITDCTLVLENTAHGNRSVGSNLHDFKVLLTKLDYPDRIQFCIDTAHAFAYGYDIKHAHGRRDFMNIIKNTIGFERVALIHLNDVNFPCGSLMDHHYVTGNGAIGKRALQQFVAHENMRHVPCVLELPHMPLDQQIEIVHNVNAWRHE